MYWLFLIPMLLCAVLACSASAKVHSTYRAQKEIPTRSHATGYDTAVRLLRANGINDVEVGRVRGELTDHYHPKKKQVNLSAGVFGDDSVAAVAIAAHEIGHVVQERKGYLPYKLRSILVPITNLGSRLALPLVLVGLILDLFVTTAGYSDLGYYLAIAGVVLYGLSTVFALVTLPVRGRTSVRLGNAFGGGADLRGVAFVLARVFFAVRGVGVPVVRRQAQEMTWKKFFVENPRFHCVKWVNVC